MWGWIALGLGYLGLRGLGRDRDFESGWKQRQREIEAVRARIEAEGERLRQEAARKAGPPGIPRK